MDGRFYNLYNEEIYGRFYDRLVADKIWRNRLEQANCTTRMNADDPTQKIYSASICRRKKDVADYFRGGQLLGEAGT